MRLVIQKVPGAKGKQGRDVWSMVALPDVGEKPLTQAEIGSVLTELAHGMFQECIKAEQAKVPPIEAVPAGVLSLLPKNGGR